MWKIFSSVSPKEGKEVRLGGNFASPPPFIQLLIIQHIWPCLCVPNALVECVSVCVCVGLKAKRRHLTASASFRANARDGFMEELGYYVRR